MSQYFWFKNAALVSRRDFFQKHTQDNVLSNVAWARSRWEWVTHLYLDILDVSWALCLTRLPIDANIAPKAMITK